MFYYKLKIDWKKVLLNHLSLTLKNDIMRTGDILKQTHFVKNLHVENLRLFKKRIHVNLFQEDISKF